MTEEATWSSTSAASLLGLSRQRVDQLYRSGRLNGPSRLPGSPILLYTSSVESEISRRQAHRFDHVAAKSQAQPGQRSQDEAHIVATVAARLEGVERRLSMAEAANQTLRTASLALNSVFDDLRDALTEDDEAIDLLAEALKRSRRAMAAVRRAEERRASILDQFLTPDFAPDSGSLANQPD